MSGITLISQTQFFNSRDPVHRDDDKITPRIDLKKFAVLPKDIKEYIVSFFFNNPKTLINIMCVSKNFANEFFNFPLNHSFGIRDTVFFSQQLTLQHSPYFKKKFDVLNKIEEACPDQENLRENLSLKFMEEKLLKITKFSEKFKYLKQILNHLTAMLWKEYGNYTSRNVQNYINVRNEILQSNPNITELKICNYRMTSIPPEIIFLINLTNINACQNNLIILTPEIGALTKLEKFNLARNFLKELPSEIGNLKNLKELNIYQNKLESLPPEIGNLESLTLLNSGDNLIAILPSEIGHLVELKELDFFNNELKTIPTTISNLKSLTHLNFFANKFQSISCEIGQLTNLELTFRTI